MGLFSKKYCDICGNKIGLLGNRKLEDGNLCKDCASKLSPWFSERRHSTVDGIRGQLAYREENKEAVKSFNMTRSIGKNNRLLIDDEHRKFTVAHGSDPLASNPDILDFSQALGCDLEVNESRHEKKHSVDGKQVSYDPPKYEHLYTFKARIRVKDNPYFDEMEFYINDGSINTGETAMGTGFNSGWTMSFAVRGAYNVEKYNECIRIGNEMKQAVDEMKMPSSPQVVQNQEAEPQNVEPQDVQPQPAQPRSDWFCPECGTPNKGKFCTNCGTPRP